MRRYTTPRLLIKVSGADLTGCDVYVTFRQGRREHTVKNPPMQVDGTDAYMEVRLTQMQSARFRHDRPVEVEANVVDFSVCYVSHSGVAGSDSVTDTWVRPRPCFLIG